MWPSRVNSCGLLSETSAGQPACFSQMIYRHGEGRWSDGSARRRMKKSRDNFRRDSPARVPQGLIRELAFDEGNLGTGS